MTLQIATSDIFTLVLAAFAVGAVVGGLANLWAIALTTSRHPESGGPTTRSPARSSPWYQLIPILGCILSRGKSHFRGRTVGFKGLAVEAATGLLFVAFVLAAGQYDCQQTPEVQPDQFWKEARVAYHLVLLGLLVAATATDVREYVIPDQITLPGALIGIGAAAFAGQLQMIHLWVDWNQEIPGISGPFIPAWLDAHRHWHGFAWSIAGGLVGAGLTWICRIVSSRILGREALGFGDVTLMGMIGTFLGWQPMIFVFTLAPLCGLAFVAPIRALTSRSYLPYGPFLAAATVLVLFFWRRIWLSTRLVFGDPLSLALLSGAATATFVILLILMRVYRTPGGDLGDDSDAPDG